MTLRYVPGSLGGGGFICVTLGQRYTRQRAKYPWGKGLAAVCTCKAVRWPKIRTTTTSWYEQRIEQKIKDGHMPVLVLYVVVAQKIGDQAYPMKASTE